MYYKVLLPPHVSLGEATFAQNKVKEMYLCHRLLLPPLVWVDLVWYV
jgi:hypothetical protein